MHEHANAMWNIPKTGYNWDHIHLAVAMDIRAQLLAATRELEKLNRVAQCPNMAAVPHILRAIEKNTRKKKKKANANKSSDRSS